MGWQPKAAATCLVVFIGMCWISVLYVLYFLYVPYIFPYRFLVGVRVSLTVFLIPARLGDGAWMGWESLSAVAVAVVAAAVAVVAAAAAVVAVAACGTVSSRVVERR